MQKCVRIAIVILALRPGCICQTPRVSDNPDEGKLVKMRLEKAERSSAAASRAGLISMRSATAAALRSAVAGREI